MVSYDSAWRQTSTTSPLGVRSEQEWSAGKDIVLSATVKQFDGDPGLRSTTIYDAQDRPTDSYGPAPVG